MSRCEIQQLGKDECSNVPVIIHVLVFCGAIMVQQWSCLLSFHLLRKFVILDDNLHCLNGGKDGADTPEGSKD